MTENKEPRIIGDYLEYPDYTEADFIDKDIKDFFKGKTCMYYDPLLAQLCRVFEKVVKELGDKK